MKKILIILLSLISLPLFSQTNYYIKNGGNDGLTGLSDAQAWATIAKISGKAFTAGDSILLKRGSTWNVNREATNLNLTESGTALAPIVISAYGTGAKPIITGRDTVPAWSGAGSWTNSSGNIWYLSNAQFTSGMDMRIWINGVEKRRCANTTVVALTPWTTAASKLYVYSVGNPATTYTLIEYSGSSSYRCIKLDNSNYIHIRNLDLRGSHHNIQILNGGLGIEIDSCLIGRDVSTDGVYVRSELGDISEDGKIYNCVFDTHDTLKDGHRANNTHDGVSFYGGGNWEVYNNEFINWSHMGLDFEVYLTAGIAGHDSMDVHDNYFTAKDIDYGGGFNFDSGSDGVFNKVYNNKFYHLKLSNQIGGSGVAVYYNVIDSVLGYTYMTDIQEATGLYISDFDEPEIPSDIQVFNNTIVNGVGYGISIISYKGAAGGVSDVNISNNLLSGNGTGATNYQIWSEDDAYISDITYRNNLVYKLGTTDLVYYGHDAANDYPHTVAEFNLENGNSGDVISGNIVGDPSLLNILFSDSLQLTSASPAINSGVVVGLTTDYDSVTVGTPPSVGAYEFDSPNYYVDNTGTGDTLSLISDVNALVSADTVFLKKGCLWRETLTVPNSGIVFMSYGTGNKPKILGSTQATTFSDCTGNVWKSATSLANPRAGYQAGAVSAEIHFVEADDSVKWGSFKADTASLIAEYNWTWLSNYVYVYAATDPDSRYDSVEVPQRQSCIDLNNKEYLEFNGLELVYAAYEGITYDWNLAMLERTGLTIDDCKIGYIGGDLTGSGAGFGIDAMYDDMIVRNCEIFETGRRGLGFHLYGSGFTVDNILVEENTFHDGYHTTGVDISVGSASYTANVDSIVIRQNLFYDPPTATETCHQIFVQNYEYATDLVYVTNVYIYNNIFKTPKSSAVMLEGAESVYIYNNTFYNHNTTKIANTSHVWVDANCDMVKIKNNLFYTDLASSSGYIGMELYEGASQAHANIDADYNLYYRTADGLIIIRANGTSYYRTVASFDAVTSGLGWETNSPNPADPLFINVTSPMETDSLIIGALSPAKDAGLGLGFLTTYDYRDSLRDGTPDIGALEYDPVDYTPPPLMPSVTTTTPVARHTRLVAVGGSSIGDGGGTITAKGVCYSLTANPTTSDSKVSGGTGTANFGVLCPVTANTVWHFRAYVTNGEGTAYGPDETATTPVRSYVKTGGKYLKYNGKICILH